MIFTSFSLPSTSSGLAHHFLRLLNSLCMLRHHILVANSVLSPLYIAVYKIFIIRAEISREVSQRSIPGVENPEWHGMKEDISQVLKKWSSPMVWKFPPEQIENPAKVADYLKENYSGSSKEGQLIALYWDMNVYSKLFITAQQHLQLEGKGN